MGAIYANAGPFRERVAMERRRKQRSDSPVQNFPPACPSPGKNFPFPLVDEFRARQGRTRYPVSQPLMRLSADGSPARPLRILIVDDTPSDVELLTLALEPHGAEFTRLADGGAARDCLSTLRPGAFDLVLLDWRLPGVNGDELALEYLARPDRDPALSICLITSALPPGVTYALVEAGAHVLEKPIDLDGYDRLAALLARLVPPG